ncbi:MAG: hypothetical protein E6Q97_17210 [Desulfurellales bacterium]|nr:MAG: hypothetical protein E6Q97_17210 [Desulfurellales bacterium]
MKAILVKRTSSGRFIASDMDGNRAIYQAETDDQHEECYDLALRKLCDKMGWTGIVVRGYLAQGRVYVWLKEDGSNRLVVGGEFSVEGKQ